MVYTSLTFSFNCDRYYSFHFCTFIFTCRDQKCHKSWVFEELFDSWVKFPRCPKLHWFCAVKQPTATTLSTRRNTTFPAKSTVYLVQPLNLNCLFQVDAASSDSAASVWDQLKVPEEMFGFLLDRDQLAEARVKPRSRRQWTCGILRWRGSEFCAAKCSGCSWSGALIFAQVNMKIHCTPNFMFLICYFYFFYFFSVLFSRSTTLLHSNNGYPTAQMKCQGKQLALPATGQWHTGLLRVRLSSVQHWVLSKQTRAKKSGRPSLAGYPGGWVAGIFGCCPQMNSCRLIDQWSVSPLTTEDVKAPLHYTHQPPPGQSSPPLSKTSCWRLKLVASLWVSMPVFTFTTCVYNIFADRGVHGLGAVRPVNLLRV